MTISHSPGLASGAGMRPGLVAVLAGLLPAACALSGPPRPAKARPAAPAPVATSIHASAALPDSALAIEIARAGLEGVAAARTGNAFAFAYENRHFRQPATALGVVAHLARE